MKGLILVTGSEGLVGSRFVEISDRKNFLHFPKQVELDITNKDEITALVSSYNFSAVVHFAAYTDVGKAEEQRGNREESCWQVNVEGTKNLVEAISPHKGKIHLIHISTDMVFPGGEDDPGPYKEDHLVESDMTRMTWYGFTKAQAENIVIQNLGNSATILRINYPVRVGFDNKLDYLRKHLSLYDEGKLYPLFTDQHFTITYIDEACRVIDKLITEGHKGVFHDASSDVTTPYKLISYMIEKTRGVTNAVESKTLKEFLEETKSPAFRYPKFGGLKVAMTEAKLGMKFSTWKEIVDKLVEQGLGENVYKG